MRTTITLDHGLLAEATEYTGIRERTALIHEGVRAIVQPEATRGARGASRGAREALHDPLASRVIGLEKALRLR